MCEGPLDFTSGPLYGGVTLPSCSYGLFETLNVFGAESAPVVARKDRLLQAQFFGDLVNEVDRPADCYRDVLGCLVALRYWHVVPPQCVSSALHSVLLYLKPRPEVNQYSVLNTAYVSTTFSMS